MPPKTAASSGGIKITPEVEALIDEQVAARLEEERLKAEALATQAKLRELEAQVDKLDCPVHKETLGALQREIGDLKLQIKVLADGYTTLADAVIGVESGQLSTKARAKVLGYSGGGAALVTGIIEALSRLFGG